MVETGVYCSIAVSGKWDGNPGGEGATPRNF